MIQRLYNFDVLFIRQTQTLHRVQIKKVPLIFFTITFTNIFYDFWYTTLQINTNHISKFTTLRAMYVPYLVT